MPDRLLPPDQIASAILSIRGRRVLLDYDLARFYGVETKVLNQERLRSQFVTLDSGRRRHRKFRALAFTEQGVAMLSSVLRSPRAIEVNIEIMRAFVNVRRTLESTAGLARKLEALERRYDAHFADVFEAIRQLVLPPGTPRRRIGYEAKADGQALPAQRNGSRLRLHADDEIVVPDGDQALCVNRATRYSRPEAQSVPQLPSSTMLDSRPGSRADARTTIRRRDQCSAKDDRRTV